MPTSRIPLIYGSAAFGKPNTDITRIHDLETCQKVLDVFVKEHGYKELDNARSYGGGSSEEFLGKLDLHGARVDTKAPPPYTREKFSENVAASMKALGPKIKIRVYYLHMPDRNTGYEKICEAINEEYKAGHFEEFGLSNLWSWEVALIYSICKERGYVLPTVYQGVYNALNRTVEHDLFSCLRKLNIRFTAFSPLAGGLLAGSLQSKDDPGQPGGRFDAKLGIGKAYRGYFTQGNEFEALAVLKEAGKKHNLSLTEIALRWIQHHSAMKPEDGVIVGASSVQQIKDNCKFSEKGPLPEDVVKACEEAWEIAKPKAVMYTR